jgi:hypothetical protein
MFSRTVREPAHPIEASRWPALAGLLAAVVLATEVTACSPPSDDPINYDSVVATVQSIAYEPDQLSELLGHRVVLDLRRYGATDGYYVEGTHQISFRCRYREDDFRGGLGVVARVVDFESLSNGITTITLDSCTGVRE